MKTLLVLLALGLAVVAVPATAEAHTATCYVFDVGCVIQCQIDHVFDLTDLPHRCLLWID